MTDAELLDEPRSWPRVIVDGLRAHAATLWFLASVFFVAIVALDVAVILHLNGIEIGALAAAEARTGEYLAAKLNIGGVMLHTALHTSVAVLSLREWQQARGDGP